MIDDTYQPQFIAKAAQMAKLGATDALLATAFDVNLETVEKWKKEHPGFLRALNQNAARLDSEVAESLFDQAVGYQYTTQESKKVKDKDGNERLEVVDVVKHVAPKVNATIHWLKCRQPELWRELQDKSEIAKSDLVTLLKQITNTSRGLPNAQNSPQKITHDAQA